MNNQLAKVEVFPPVKQPEFMPAMTIDLAVERYHALNEFVGRLMRKDTDFGQIPGTDKLTLLKPGAEKLTTFFGLSTRFQLIERVEDWSGRDHNNEPFFYYLYRCQLFRGDQLVAESDGSCNSRETKYRYREAQRQCPDCKVAAIIKGKEEFGGGFICFKKKGGCGAKYASNDPAIVNQTVGRIPNPDIADQVNTIQKMASKRSLIAATLLAVNASEFFTQDIEDFTSTEPHTSQQPSALPQTVEPHQPEIIPQSVNSQQEHDELDILILEATAKAKRTREDLFTWINKKYQVDDGLNSLSTHTKREILNVFNRVKGN